jgi:hypothetical protein
MWTGGILGARIKGKDQGFIEPRSKGYSNITSCASYGKFTYQPVAVERESVCYTADSQRC